MNKLELVNISKHYGSKRALNGLTVTFTDGVCGLLGPNGAGKSTLMNIMTQNIPCDKGGKITWNGTPAEKAGADYRSIIGFMPQQQELYPSFTARRFISYIAALKGIEPKKIKEETERVLSLVKLEADTDKKIGGFSGGMKQRVLIAQALLGNPKLLVLDEPTAGLDPKQRVIIRRLIREMSRNRIVVVSTHIVSDIETVADRVILIKGGEMIGDGSVKELTEEVKEGEKNLENLYLQYYGDEL